MFDWISAHFGDLLISGILLIIIIFVIRYLLKQRKLGPCAGCTCGTNPKNCNYKDLSLEELEKLLEQQDFFTNKS